MVWLSKVRCHGVQWQCTSGVVVINNVNINKLFDLKITPMSTGTLDRFLRRCPEKRFKYKDEPCLARL